MSVPSFFKTIKEKSRGYFIAGLLTVVPMSFTAYILNILWGKLDRVLNLLPKTYNPKSYIPFPSPGLGIALVLLSVLHRDSCGELPRAASG